MMLKFIIYLYKKCEARYTPDFQHLFGGRGGWGENNVHIFLLKMLGDQKARIVSIK